MMLVAVSVVCAIAALVPLAYLYLLLWASTRPARPVRRAAHDLCRFNIAIPAYNEALHIGQTVASIRQADYPAHLLHVYVVADNGSDDTAQVARQAGAHVFERTDGERSGKGSALTWMFQRMAAANALVDAIAVFDADTQVHPAFFRIMSERLQAGAQVIQGNHVIRNPGDGWFSALTWAMFLVDNRVQNRGRDRLGWSAKNMGDAICLQADLLRAIGWGEGLTEDYFLRHRLLLKGVTIAYEPAAIAYGEAPTSLAVARRQRARWLKGTYDASRRHVWQLVRQGLHQRNGALLDGALQSLLPSYSTLTLLAVLVLAAHLILTLAAALTGAWAAIVVLLSLYPYLALALERAPARAYAAISLGPFFIVWRTAVALWARLGRQPVTWIRTRRRGET